MTRKLFIVRGLPGSGKSTFAREMKALSPKTVEHFEADMFFEKDGEYGFRPELLPVAHNWCRNAVDDALFSGKTVFVTNTFTQQWEIEPYILIANKYMINVSIIKMEDDHGSIHDVPASKIEQMKARWENLNEL